MRFKIVTVLCFAFVTAVHGSMPTITVRTIPETLSISVGGDYVGIGEAVFFGPFDDYLEVEVEGKGYETTTRYIDPPTADGEHVITVISPPEDKGFSWASFGLGIGSGAGLFFLVLYLAVD
ncbi:MAG: hypothetical protein JSW52_03580 [Candidatus Coatesbacteria bacterium]|nr:MAG: hypothetical protein JSW52_03580 [Candidatus Coatesbacteria bacterium]